MPPLNSDELYIIKEKGTEIPFTGKYWNYFKDGIYVCRQCGLPLFDAKAKFEANCGWPSFDATFPHAVKEFVDPDGVRTEIECARCGAHLGHVFRGEKLTEKDTRHCANSLSLQFVPREDVKNFEKDHDTTVEAKEIVLGGGCFWCIEASLMRVPGVLNAISGYAGGDSENPTYEKVLNGNTGYAEVVKVTYDNKTIPLDKLLDIFYTIHDPTTPDRQGNDVGSQYRSIIFYSSAQEKEIIEKFIAKRQPEYSAKIVTEVKELARFYKAEEYHQRYFEKNPYAAYCQVVIQPKIAKVISLKR